MKILFLGISGYEYPHVRIRCYRFAEKLRSMGYDSEVLSYKDHLAPEVQEEQMYAFGDRKKLSLTWAALKKINRISPDVLYLQKLHYHTAAALLWARLKRVPFILDYDDYEIGSDHHGNPLFCGFRRPLLNRFFYGASVDGKILEKTARSAICCVAASHSLVTMLSKYHNRVSYIPTGVDTSRFKPERRAGTVGSDTFVFIWTGIVWGETIAENLRFCIDALCGVRKIHPGAVLKIIGGGAYMDSVRQYASSAASDGAVIFEKWVSPDRMPGLLREADAGLIAMIRSTTWTESKSPTKLFEYLASGLPVVATPVGEIRYIIRNEKNGLLADDQDGFTRSMSRLIEDRDLREKLSKSARLTAETEYAQDVLAGRLAAVLDSVSQDPGRS